MSALNKKSFLTYLKEGGIYVVLLVLLAIIIFQDPTFLSLLNLSNILTQSSVRIIIALGVAGLIVTQGTDLSAGRQVGLAPQPAPGVPLPRSEWGSGPPPPQGGPEGRAWCSGSLGSQHLFFLFGAMFPPSQ